MIGNARNPSRTVAGTEGAPVDLRGHSALPDEVRPQHRRGAEAGSPGDLVDWQASILQHPLGQPNPLR